MKHWVPITTNAMPSWSLGSIKRKTVEVCPTTQQVLLGDVYVHRRGLGRADNPK